MTKLQQRVELFMNKAGQRVPDVIEVPSSEQRLLRVKLLLEEVLEYASAAGIKVCIKDDYELANTELSLDNLSFSDEKTIKLVDMIDGLCDTIYVAVGGQLEIGIDPEPFDTEVCNSNDSKFIDGHRAKNGKWIKGKSYRPVDLEAILKNQAFRQQMILRDDEMQLKLNLD
jgi:predicted HAD superfamily Cof-like phosphohydrolase